jgi:hypothetical protein
VNPLDTIPAWPKSDALERIEMCRATLSIHGFLSEAEGAKVKKRVKVWIEKNGLKAISTPLLAVKEARRGK